MLPEIIAFLAGTAVLYWLSRHALRKPGSHGFYRFFVWESILVLVILNHRPWGEDPSSPHQIASWILMLLSIALVLLASRHLINHGKASEQRTDDALYGFEKTTQLVTTGMFSRIRHPMYSSLLALIWGVYFQDPNLVGTLVAAFGCISLWLTARADEVECLAYFGQPYADYMQRTRRFIPYIF